MTRKHPVMYRTISAQNIPRLPLAGHIDLTYRCNNHCLHCWLWVSEQAPVQKEELSFAEICYIVTQARSLGCRRWNISGGEPMLRPDFPEIFDLLTHKASGYGLNTNGTLITPQIARLLKRKGNKMVALYGADAEVYDAVTRHPGGFEKLMQGIAYLKEADARFTVQLIPMRANWHQWDAMLELAGTLSPHSRVGAPWLYLSCDASAERNREIAAQRLTPHQVIELDQPNPAYSERIKELNEGTPSGCGDVDSGDDRLFAKCIERRRDFHIDPYGKMSWCSFIKDPRLRYDLKLGTFTEAWERFIPACADVVHGGEEWRKNCGSCEKRKQCRWCAVYAYLETGRHSASIPHLCEVAKEAERFKESWKKNHRRYFQIAGITVRIESDLDFKTIRFKDELQAFAVDGPGEDNVTFRHHFAIPGLSGKDLGEELYRKPPWAIYRKKNTWFYCGISPVKHDTSLHRVAVFSADHRHGTFYSDPRSLETILAKGWPSLSLFSTDQIWLGPLLADRQAVLLHSAAAIVNGKGLVFTGHSEAGKSTTMELLKAAHCQLGLHAKILCDDRNVIRLWPDGWKVHGTWSHGTTADVSPASAPLRGILFLKQAPDNQIVAISDRKQIWRHLLATLIRPMVTAEWWHKELNILERIVSEVPCYVMHFDKTGAIVPHLDQLSR